MTKKVLVSKNKNKKEENKIKTKTTVKRNTESIKSSNDDLPETKKTSWDEHAKKLAAAAAVGLVGMTSLGLRYKKMTDIDTAIDSLYNAVTDDQIKRAVDFINNNEFLKKNICEKINSVYGNRCTDIDTIMENLNSFKTYIFSSSKNTQQVFDSYKTINFPMIKTMLSKYEDHKKLFDGDHATYNKLANSNLDCKKLITDFDNKMIKTIELYSEHLFNFNMIDMHIIYNGKCLSDAIDFLDQDVHFLSPIYQETFYKHLTLLAKDSRFFKKEKFGRYDKNDTDLFATEDKNEATNLQVKAQSLIKVRDDVFQYYKDELIKITKLTNDDSLIKAYIKKWDDQLIQNNRLSSDKDNRIKIQQNENPFISVLEIIEQKKRK
jgi:hypothetical protein